MAVGCEPTSGKASHNPHDEVGLLRHRRAECGGLGATGTAFNVHNRVGTRRSTGSWRPAAVRKVAESF